MLAEMAVNDPHGFAVLVARIKGEPEPARKAAPAVAAAAPATETAASAPAPVADTTVVAPVAQGEVQTEEEKDLEAAGVPEEKPAGQDERPEHGDPQQGESR
jgi:hypothetical protein